MRFERVLFGAPWFALIGLLLILIIWPSGRWVEQTFFPVVRNVEIHDVQKEDDGVSFYASYDVVRSCEFLGVMWYHGPIRIGIELPSPSGPRTIPEGPQYSGPLEVSKVDSLEGTHATAIFRCHPLWETSIRIYP